MMFFSALGCLSVVLMKPKLASPDPFGPFIMVKHPPGFYEDIGYFGQATRE